MAEREVVWSAKASSDLQNIIEYWVEETGNGQYSSKLHLLIKQSISILKTFPNTGRISDFKDVRVKPVLNYLIYYLANEEEIKILRIWDSRRNPKKLKV